MSLYFIARKKTNGIIVPMKRRYPNAIFITGSAICTWYIVQPEFYDNQRQGIVEDTFHKAALKAGKFDCAYLDHGVQYTASHLGEACAKLGIRIVHAKPGACQPKGKIEKFHQKEAHAGIREYYGSYGAKAPACGITPEQEWMGDAGALYL